MPFNASGKLTIVASSDLGGLGSRDGSPITFNWVLPGVAPMLLPWLVILALLALKPNRHAAAWLIWLPLGCVTAITLAPLPDLPEGTSFFLDVVAALAVGLAAVWLLTNYLRQQNRFVTFLCVLLALAGFSVLAAVAKRALSLLTPESLVIGIMLAAAVWASAMALILGGLICRGRYRPVGLFLWLLILVAAFWLVIAVPFFLFVVLVSGGNVPLSSWSEFFIPVFAIMTANYLTLLPFLILSSASPFFRERLKTLLHIKEKPKAEG